VFHPCFIRGFARFVFGGPIWLDSLVVALLAALFTAGSLSAQENLQEQEEQAIRSAAERIAPSVVRIETIGGLERVGRVLVNTGPTTGLVVADDGYVISSAFNFVQQPSSILVTLPSGKRSAAKIVARDHSRMLVLLKVNTTEKLAVPPAVPRGEMTVGQWAIAVGRTYDQPGPNLSVGVVSAINRIWSTAIQTDAKISPANYGGPLIDIEGRVLGVLVPLSPQKQGGEIAGAEWYDSGIGFAVPLVDIFERLATLKSGQDLHPGLMGISLKAGDPYSLPAELAVAQAGSPAYKAGLRAADTIIELDGTPIARQAQLKHALGPHYAGDKIHIVFTRGKDNERKETDVELAEKLVPYEHPFLGVLPLRDKDEAPGVRVRYVYPAGPAAAELKTSDRIVALDGTAVTDAEQLRTLVANLEPKAKATVEIERGGQTLKVQLMPGKLSTEIPESLPPATAEPLPPPAEKPRTGIIDIKLPEEKNECFAYVPEGYHPQLPHGLLIVLSSPGPVDREKLVARWKSVCDERQLILLAPLSAAADKWQPTETAFIRKTLDDVLSRYNVDRARIAVYGYQAGGAMAYLVGFEHRDRVRAIVAIDAVPPPRSKLPDVDPLNRLDFFIGHAEKSPSAPLMKVLFAALEAEKFPITKTSLGDEPRDLDESELAKLGRWLDALDRI
jgi:S1-C subfamily serine protease/predicted esterase